ncbi:hypothetical protein [Frankia sp. AgB32]|uniref:hypothetical protein n=1 Tax=Frankia sp. AgB32 TaxID=631119 RepID=UPI00200CCD38|nr:hypothetical protein [Frankia sp. AgB32]MCK9894708.1 hypothetical protein [Frankia sp. AgB32]
MVENTARRDPFTHLLGAEGMGPAAYTEDMEAAGGEQLAASDLLPVNLHPADEQVWTDLGFVLGDPVDGDPLFRHATLPAGWIREVSREDPRWSVIRDEQGVERVRCWYKAAYYDRNANARLTGL